MLAACSSSSQTASEDSDTVELRFFHRWPTEPKKQYFEEAVKEFEELHPI